MLGNTDLPQYFKTGTFHSQVYATLGFPVEEPAGCFHTEKGNYRVHCYGHFFILNNFKLAENLQKSGAPIYLSPNFPSRYLLT